MFTEQQGYEYCSLSHNWFKVSLFLNLMNDKYIRTTYNKEAARVRLNWATTTECAYKQQWKTRNQHVRLSTNCLTMILMRSCRRYSCSCPHLIWRCAGVCAGNGLSLSRQDCGRVSQQDNIWEPGWWGSGEMRSHSLTNMTMVWSRT